MDRSGRDKDEGNLLVTKWLKGTRESVWENGGTQKLGASQGGISLGERSKVWHVNFEMKVGYPVENIHKVVGKVDHEKESKRQIGLHSISTKHWFN